MEKTKWETIDNPLTGLEQNNFILRGKDFFISYNPDSGRSKVGAMIDNRANILGALVDNREKGGGEETALVKNDKFFILNGDFRKQYEKLISKGFDACHKFYLKNRKEHGSAFTEDYDEINLKKTMNKKEKQELDQFIGYAVKESYLDCQLAEEMTYEQKRSYFNQCEVANNNNV